jgi:hypothetical protein
MGNYSRHRIRITEDPEWPMHLASALNTPAWANGYSTFLIKDAESRELRCDEFVSRIDI